MGTNVRIVKNTIFLYIRMLLLIVVQLYSIPIILKTLGVEDYGIYNVVGGIVTLFSFVSGSLASGSQRFFSFAIGKEDTKSLKTLFSSTLLIYLAIDIIVVIILETVGVWFLNNRMTIPDARLHAANWVFHLSILTFFISIFTIPYNSFIIAHEKMSIYAYVSMFEGGLKLAAALSLKYVPYDYLIAYAVFICLITLIVCAIYRIYCRMQFEECKGLKFAWDPKVGKSLVSYSGWNMIGSLALIGRNQGLNIVINLFFGPILNAAHSIAQQINGVLIQFINNVYLAARPQITKYYAQEQEEEMWRLTFESGKWSFYLLTFLSVPAILELRQVLNIWLHEVVPEFTYEISLFLIITLLVETTTNQIIAVFQAQNKMKKYQILGSTILLYTVPISYFVLKINSSHVLLPYIVSLLLSVIYITAILVIAKKEVQLNVANFLRNVMVRMILVFVLSFVASFILSRLLPEQPIRIIYTSIISVVVVFAVVWTLGLSRNEKTVIKQFVISKLSNR